MLRKPSIVEIGDSVPEPLGFNAFAPECCSTLKALVRRIGLRRDATRAPMQGPEWQGAASPPPQTQTQTPPETLAYRGQKLVLTMGSTLSSFSPARNQESRSKAERESLA
jgi:hypothetical protein